MIRPARAMTAQALEPSVFFTAGVNGARVDEIQAIHLGTNVATALRIFINNGSDPTVATNNFFV